MPRSIDSNKPYLEELAQLFSKPENNLLQSHHENSTIKMVRTPRTNNEFVQRRWHEMGYDNVPDSLYNEHDKENIELYGKNIEYAIGTIKLPVGVAGPLRVNGIHAQGDFIIPLATTEAALVASYHRGACLITKAGGAMSALLGEGVGRSPGFAFHTLLEAGQFIAWATSQFPHFITLAQATTAHGKLVDMKMQMEGNHVYMYLEYTTGDASGQNMVTIATNAVYEYILENSPVIIKHAFLEANFSGDKKASAMSFLGVRGKKVTTEINLSRDLIEAVLHTTPEMMLEYWRMSALGGVLSGTIGVQGHYANGLAAFYIATGQDAACVAESAVGVTRFELNEQGGLYASVTLPNIMVGTVGGGTGLPGQKACLDILGLSGTGHARALAEVIGAVCLAGELSIIGALCANHFARAHQQLARGKS
jgi:hydroxymethylglutaryl-CoA reductase (NADPH)